MFASSPVQELLELPYPGRSLGFLVIPESPSPVAVDIDIDAAYVDIDVCYTTGYTSKYRTYCGAPAIFRARHKMNGYCDAFMKSTIGGIVQVSYSDGKTRLYGMTAGHVPSALQGQAHLCSAEKDDAMQSSSTLNILEWISGEARRVFETHRRKPLARSIVFSQMRGLPNRSSERFHLFE